MNIPKDKLYHAIAGAGICLGAWLIWGNLELALWIAILVGVLKELYDAKGYGTPEVWDAVATALGGLLVYEVIKGIG